MVTIMSFPKNSELVFKAIIEDINNIKDECMYKYGLKMEDIEIAMSFDTYEWIKEYIEINLPLFTDNLQNDFSYICGCKIIKNHTLKFGEIKGCLN